MITVTKVLSFKKSELSTNVSYIQLTHNIIISLEFLFLKKCELQNYKNHLKNTSFRASRYVYYIFTFDLRRIDIYIYIFLLIMLNNKINFQVSNIKIFFKFLIKCLHFPSINVL